jgi:hypothetical protein
MGDKGPSRMGLMLALIAAAVAVVSKAQPLSLSLDLSLSFSRVQSKCLLSTATPTPSTPQPSCCLPVGRPMVQAGSGLTRTSSFHALLILTAVPVTTGASVHFSVSARFTASCHASLNEASIHLCHIRHIPPPHLSSAHVPITSATVSEWGVAVSFSSALSIVLRRR